VRHKTDSKTQPESLANAKVSGATALAYRTQLIKSAPS